MEVILAESYLTTFDYLLKAAARDRREDDTVVPIPRDAGPSPALGQQGLAPVREAPVGSPRLGAET